MQWDGFVIKSKKWNNEFMKYDYIGAPLSQGVMILITAGTLMEPFIQLQ